MTLETALLAALSILAGIVAYFFKILFASAGIPWGVMEIFASEGWMPAGVFWSRDAMHFQATR